MIEEDTMASSYYNLPTHSLESHWLKLEVLSEGGLRVVRLFFNNSETNLLAEVPHLGLETPYGLYSLRGGHRLWAAPEKEGVSAIPEENIQISIEPLENGLRVSQGIEKPTGLQKSMEIHLHPAQPRVSILHTIQNLAEKTIEIAPWAITQLPIGGLAVLPLREKPLKPSLLPDRNIVLWPYTELHDSRLEITDEFLFVKPSSNPQPVKVGNFNRLGWIAYFLEKILFIKRFDIEETGKFVDCSSNSEIFTNDKYLEAESIGPLSELEPGASCSHFEEWRVYPLDSQPQNSRDAVGHLIKLGIAK
jgi:hypothetical protein